jgi:uncharacterized protein
MNSPQSHFTRRDFLRATGAVGLGSMLLPSMLRAADEAKPKVARRKFGKTGVDVSLVSLGCMFPTIDNQIILKTAYEHGVTHWDTAASYEKGGSEVGIGMFLEKNPAARKELFIVTKAGNNFAKSLDESLARMKTDYADLFFVHGPRNLTRVNTAEVKEFAEAAKKSGKIRFFGFSTHSNMPAMLTEAATMGWIDGIMLTYNYREMHKPEMRAAVDACEKAGIGLTAMKTMAERGASDTPEQAALLEPLRAKGFTPGQAKLKAVMANPQIATACVQMPNMRFCRENIAAALDLTRLAADDRATLERYAAATCSGYCSGCSHLCESAMAGAVPVRDVMRHLMYHHSYGPEVDARALFQELPAETRARLVQLDYAAAERVCPNRLPIGRMMREASQLLA